MKKLSFFFLLLFNVNLYAQPPGCSSGTAANGAPGQSGLLGEYFAGYFADNTSFFPSSLSTTNRIEANLSYNFNNWGAIVPPASNTVADPNLFSARFRGSIYIAIAGTYTFYLTSDDASFLWMDNSALTYPSTVLMAFINNGGYHGDLTVSSSLYLAAGLHNLQIQYGENNSGNHLVFEYQNTALGIARQAVPNSILCTSIQPAIVIPAPTGCICVDPSSNTAKSGLYGEYYAGYYADNQSFFNTTPGLVRTDGTIGFSTDNGWGSISPPAGGTSTNPDLYSVRWRGSIYLAVAGTYTFYLTSDDASYLWLDGAAAVTTPTAAAASINNGGLHVMTMVSYTGIFTAGFHQLKIHYGENTSNNKCTLEYASSAISRTVVPQNILCTCMPELLLPVELLDFTALQYKNEVDLKWSTATETNNDQFTLSRSSNAVDWEIIARVQGAGNSNSVNTYHYTDISPGQGTNYYKLEQTDFDGANEYLDIEVVEFTNEKTPEISVFPNPFYQQLTVKTDISLADHPYTVMVTDLTGKNISVDVSPGENSLLINFPRIGKGVYLLNVEISNYRYVYKINNTGN